MPKDLFTSIEEGSFEYDDTIKKQLFDWLDDIWQQKDQLISTMRTEFAQLPKA